MPKEHVPKRSSIWIYFNEDTKGLGRCTICGSSISTRGGSTSNLRRHIKLKHKKITLEKPMTKRPSIKRNDVTGNRSIDESDNGQEMLVIQQGCEGNEFHSEVVFHDYTTVGSVEVGMDQPETSQATLVWEERPGPKKPNILRQSKKQKRFTERVSDLQKKLIVNQRDMITSKQTASLITETNINNDQNNDNFKENALADIAHNLGRIATAFEKIANHLCSSNSNNKEIVDQKDSIQGIGTKVNQMIMEVLGEGERHEEEVCTFEEESQKDATLVKGLNLWPKDPIKDDSK